jgi:hypothetical protein
MDFSKKQLKEALKPLYGFSGKKIEPVGSISLPVSFGTLSNAHTEYVTFDMVDMSYPYNIIFGKGFLNTFEAALHSLYLCLKIPTTQVVISVHGNKKDVRNIEQHYAPGHRNVNYLQDNNTESHNNTTNRKNEGNGSRPTEPECQTKTVLLDPRVPDKTVMISQDLTTSEEEESLSFLDKNSDVFAWRTFDLTGVSSDIMEHKLEVNPSAYGSKQRYNGAQVRSQPLCKGPESKGFAKMSNEKVTTAKIEVQMFLDA